MAEVLTQTYRRISELTVLATDVWQFAREDGKQDVGMPYWVEYDEAMVFQWMTTETNGKWLAEMIKEGRVWIRMSDSRLPYAKNSRGTSWVMEGGRVGMRMV